MKRVWGHLLAGITLVTGAVAVMVACKHDDSTLFVQDVLLAQPVSQGQICKFTNDPTQTFITRGILDVALRSDYNPWYLLGNQSVAEVNSQQLQTETNIITVQGAVVRITDAAGNELANFTRLAAASIYPASGSVPGYSPISVTTIDQSTSASVSGPGSNVAAGGTTRLVTYVKFFGKTTGGNSVESDEFEFPVDVCFGCLIGFSAADMSPLLPLPNCALGGGTATSSVPSPCYPGQDFTLDCSQCLANPACQGAAAGMSIPTDAGPG